MKSAFGKRGIRRFFLLLVVALCTASVFAMQSKNLPGRESSGGVRQPGLTAEAVPTLLTDPFLQLPTEDSVQVVWFTEFKGTHHRVTYEDADGQLQTVEADTTQLSRTREDSDSRVQGRAYPELTRRPIWRHAATVSGLQPGFLLNAFAIAMSRKL